MHDNRLKEAHILNYLENDDKPSADVDLVGTESPQYNNRESASSLTKYMSDDMRCEIDEFSKGIENNKTANKK